VSTPLHVIFFFSSYLLNVLSQIANKNGIIKKNLVCSLSLYRPSYLKNVTRYHITRQAYSHSRTCQMCRNAVGSPTENTTRRNDTATVSVTAHAPSPTENTTRRNDTATVSVTAHTPSPTENTTRRNDTATVSVTAHAPSTDNDCNSFLIPHSQYLNFHT
jgi:hypothetical protein